MNVLSPRARMSGQWRLSFFPSQRPLSEGPYVFSVCTLYVKRLGCFRHSAYTEFCMFFLFHMFLKIPYVPYSKWSCPKFCRIMRNSVLQNSSNSAEFRGISQISATFGIMKFLIVLASGVNY
jgi:hypothetical protein